MFPCSGLTEESIEGVIPSSKGLITRHLTIRLYAMLQAVQLPASIPHLNTSLTNMDWDTFTLLVERLGSMNKRSFSFRLKNNDYYIKNNTFLSTFQNNQVTICIRLIIALMKWSRIIMSEISTAKLLYLSRINFELISLYFAQKLSTFLYIPSISLYLITWTLLVISLQILNNL